MWLLYVVRVAMHFPSFCVSHYVIMALDLLNRFSVSHGIVAFSANLRFVRELWSPKGSQLGEENNCRHYSQVIVTSI